MTTQCEFRGDRDEIIVSYLYDAIEPAARASFEAHLTVCEECRAELSDLGGVRARLAEWMPPERAPGFAPLQSSRRTGVWARLGEIPAWAQVAAAMLFLGVAAGIANLDVKYGSDGLVVRTGWSKASTAALRENALKMNASSSPARPAVDAPLLSQPWRTDLAALEERLRTEFHAYPFPGEGPRSSNAEGPRSGNAEGRRSSGDTPRSNLPPGRASGALAASGGDADLIRRVRALVEESEHRQQREIALRVAEVVRDMNAQRQADLVKIDRSLGFIQTNTGIEVAKQRELLNYLVHVSQNTQK